MSKLCQSHGGESCLPGAGEPPSARGPGKRPLITAGMHLGEGTGAVAAIPLLDMALAVYQGSSTFDETGIEAYQPLGGQP